MEADQTKSITWELVEEIVKECEYRDEDIHVSETLAAFTLKLAYQDPLSGYKESEPLSEEDVSELVENCIYRILFDYNPSMETIRMQTEYLRIYKDVESILRDHSRSLEGRLAPLSRQIVENGCRTQCGRQELYKKIVLLCILRSGLGDPRDKYVNRESTLAVQSIFPFAELEHFMNREHKLDKRKHLMELSSIVAGIRIFNWHSKQGTAVFEDLPTMLKNALQTTLKNLEVMSKYAENKINKMQEFGLLFCGENERPFLEDPPEEEEDNRVKTIIRDSLINYIQYQKYLRVIYKDASSIRGRIGQYDRQLSRAFDDVEKIITSKPILSTMDVFPKFMLLSKIWHRYQEEIIILSYLNSLNQTLHSFTRSISKSASMKKLKKALASRRTHPNTTPPPPLLDEPLIFSVPKTSRTLLEFKLHYTCNVLPADDDNIPCEFDNGFCPVTISETGLLIRGDKSLGILEFQNKYYACRDVSSGEKFAKNPESYLLEVKKLIQACPTLFRLFELTNEEASLPKKKHQSSQTNEDGGDTEGFKDPSHEWNEWELRRKAPVATSMNELRTQTEEEL